MDSVEGPGGLGRVWAGSGAGGAEDWAGLGSEKHEGGLSVVGWKGGRVGEPSKLVRIPVLGGEGPRALIAVGDGLSASLTGDTPGLEIFGRGWNTV